jgi:hypothetical protein
MALAAALPSLVEPARAEILVEAVFKELAAHLLLAEPRVAAQAREAPARTVMLAMLQMLALATLCLR